MGLQVIVVGLGRFGSAAARELQTLGHEVLAVDSREAAVNAIAPHVTHAVQADATSEETLRSLGAAQFDSAIVAMSTDAQASIFATMVLKRLGVATVIAKAGDELHGQILERVGADRVVYPEREAGIDVAHTLRIHQALDYIDLGPGFGVAKLRVPEVLVGRTLRDLDLGNRVRATAIALSRGDEMTVNPHRDETLRDGDYLVLIGQDEELAKLVNDRG